MPSAAPASDVSAFKENRGLSPWIALAAVAMIGLFAAIWWLAKGESESDRPRASEAPTAGPATPDSASLAVLPFADRSAEQDQEYFSDGLSEELITVLASISKLKVAGRSSSFAFKGRNVDSREVGRQLGVAHILEGSVRKSGDQIRISAQLVKADDGFQLWSETYDRRLDDIFQIQDDIARSVADALELKLLGTRSDASEESLPDTTTYTKTLQAQHLIRSSLSEDLSSARRLLDEALEAEPRYAPAWAALGLFHVYEGAGAADVEAKHRAMEKARSALEKAIEIDPDLPEAHSRLAITYWTLDWDFSAAERSTERALELAPNNPVVMGNAAYLFMVLGRFDDAIELQERSVQRDPLSPITFGNLAGSYEVAGRYGDAVALAEQALTLSPSRDAYETLAGALVELGRYEEAQEAADRLVEVSGLKELGLLFDVQIETRSGNEEGAQAAMRRLETIYCDQSPMLCARARAFRGDKDQAFAWLEHAMEVREPEVTEVKVYREIAPIRDDPRYPVILQKIGLPVG